jgi:hypothetical protein
MNSAGAVVQSCWLPNPGILVAAGDQITVGNPSSSDTITLDCDGNNLTYANPDDKIKTGSNLTLESDHSLGTSWKLWLSELWDHSGSTSPTAEDRKVTADWWGE